MPPAVADPVLVAITQTVVERFAPERVVLFGSRARGDHRADSDYDLLVVMDVGDGPEPRTAPVRRLLRGLGVPFDVVVYTPQEWEAYREHPLSFAHQIARASRVLHDAG